MGLSDLLEGATSSFSSIFGSSGQTSMYLTDGIEYALSEVKAKNWKLNLGYSFEVVDTGSGINAGGGTLSSLQILDDAGVGGGFGGGGFKEFKLTLNPTNIEQQESFGITVIPTQTGVVAEHQGFVMKDLTISGTTGIQPKRGAGGVTGQVNFGGSDIIPSGIPLFGGGKSGYQEIMELRNYFRSYAESKKNPGNNGMRLVFHNKKDNEHWYVEPVGPGITVSRDASRPMMYEYNITLKIVGKASTGPGRSGFFGSILDTIDRVEGFIDSVSNTIGFVAQTLNGASQFLESIEKNVEITLFNPLQKVSDALKAVKNGKNTVSSLPKKFYKDLHDNLNRVRDNVVDTFGLGSPIYNTTVGRLPAPRRRDFLTSDVVLLDAFNQGERALNRVLATDVLFAPPAGTILPASTSNNVSTAIKVNQSKNLNLRPDSVVGLTKAFNNGIVFTQPASVTDVIVEYGETIERFAMRTLGSPARIHDIIILNNLDPPYISETPIAGKHTVTSGQRLLVPNSSPSGRTDFILSGPTPLTKDMNIIERMLGVDLKLTAEGDLMVNTAVPDVDLIAGLNNAAQAIGVKIGIERGSLLFHPQIGTKVQVGSKNLDFVDDIIADIEQSITSDPRFLAVYEIGILRAEASITMNLMVKIRNLHRAVPLKLDAPNVQTF